MSHASIDFKQHASFAYAARYYNEKTGVGYSLAGAQIDVDFFEFKRETKLASRSIGAGITITDEANGYFVIELPDTSNWTTGTIVFDILIRRDGRKIYTQTIEIDTERAWTIR